MTFSPSSPFQLSIDTQFALAINILPKVPMSPVSQISSVDASKAYSANTAPLSFLASFQDGTFVLGIPSDSGDDGFKFYQMKDTQDEAYLTASVQSLIPSDVQCAEAVSELLEKRKEAFEKEAKNAEEGIAAAFADNGAKWQAPDGGRSPV